jgi:hypothetical protein
MLDYKKLKQIEKDNKNYEDLRKRSHEIVQKHLPELEYIDIAISLDHMVVYHSIDSLKGIIGVDQWTEDHKTEYPNTALGCIAHDLPRPSNLKQDIYPKVMSYTEYCTI